MLCVVTIAFLICKSLLHWLPCWKSLPRPGRSTMILFAFSTPIISQVEHLENISNYCFAFGTSLVLHNYMKQTELLHTRKWSQMCPKSKQQITGGTVTWVLGELRTTPRTMPPLSFSCLRQNTNMTQYLHTSRCSLSMCWGACSNSIHDLLAIPELSVLVKHIRQITPSVTSFTQLDLWYSSKQEICQRHISVHSKTKLRLR